MAAVAVFFVPRLLPSPNARFRKTAFGKALGEPLTDVVVASSRGGDSDARKKLLTPDVKKQIGSDACDSLTRVVDELPHVRGDGEESIDLALAPLYLEVNELDAKLAKARVPAHLHAYGSMSGGRPVVWLTSYFVENRDELTFEKQPVRFVWARRIDGLNLAENRLYKAHAEDWVIVSMDRVEEELVQTLLAAIAKGAPLAPDDSEGATSPRGELSRTASRIVSDELVAVTKVSREDADARGASARRRRPRWLS